MNYDEYLEAIKKYITILVLPKFPEIKSFEVIKKREDEWNFYTADWMKVFKINFYVDGSENDFERKLYDQIDNMIAYFDISKDIRVHWQIYKDDGTGTDTWAVH
jgi:hypothetical protein